MNIIYTISTWICLLILLSLPIYIIAKFKSLTRAERIEFIRGFKKGKCAVIYFAVLPLYIMGRLYGGESIPFATFNSIHNVVKLVILQFDLSGVKALLVESKFYAYTVYFSYLLVVVNALLFTFSLISQRIWLFFNGLKFKYSKKQKLIVIGNNPQSLEVYNSFSGAKVLLGELTDSECNDLYIKDVKYVDLKSYTDLKKWLESKFKGKKSKAYVVINFCNDEKNISVSKEIIEFVLSSGDDELLFNFGAYVFGDPRYETVYTTLVAKSNGCLHYINKYQQIAIDFIDKYPLSLFIDRKYINEESATIDSDVSLNVCFIGFGKTNQQIMLSSIANNQFIQKGENGVELKKVKYFVFDKEDAQNNKNLNHNYYRFKNEYWGNKTERKIPLPDIPAREKYYHLDVNDLSYYKKLKSIFTKNSKSVNCLIIAFGSDLENIDMARKLSEKRRDWNLPNLNIFVKVRDKKLYESAEIVFSNDNFKAYALHSKENVVFTKERDVCYIFGVESDVVYNFNQIVAEKFANMAKMRSQIYSIEYAVTKDLSTKVTEEFVEQKSKQNIIKWYKTNTQIERDSNLYAVLSIRSKLNLIGFDVVPESSELKAVSFKDYMDVYAKGDMPDFEHYSVKIGNKDVIYYPFKFPESLRKNLAIHEHLRWNAYMISKGMVLATDEQIEHEIVVDKDGKESYTNGKNYIFRRHGNLTTFEGLMAFAELIAKRDNQKLEDVDVFKYDYQLLDDAHWLLSENGYKIVKL